MAEKVIPLYLTWSLEGTSFENLVEEELAGFLREIADGIHEGETDGELNDVFGRQIVRWSTW